MGEKQNWKPGNMLYPLPAVLVSCRAPGQRPNILTVAWTGTVCTNPPMVSVSIRPERFSYAIIRDTGEFVINLTTRRLAKAADFCGVRSGRDVDKFREMNLTPEPASKVDAPLIAESPVNIECRVVRVLELGSHHLFLASVEAVDVDPAYLDARGRFDFGKAEPLAYSHGEYYALGEKLGSFGYSVRKRKESTGKDMEKQPGKDIKKSPGKDIKKSSDKDIKKSPARDIKKRSAGEIKKNSGRGPDRGKRRRTADG